MDKKTLQSLLSKRRIRVSPVIKQGATRLGTEEAVEVNAYVFGERREVCREVLEALKQIHGTMLASLEARLSLFLRAEVSLSMEDLSANKYHKTQKSVDSSFHLNIFRADPATGAGFIGLETKVALTAVNLLLGGKGDPPKENRSLTKIESDLSADLANEFLAEWKTLWKDALELGPKVYQQEKSVENFSQCDAHTGVLCLKMKLKIRETEGGACLVYPIHMIEPAVHRIQQAQHTHKQKAQALISQWSPVYNTVPVIPEVCVPVGRMSVEAFLKLQPGSVIPLEDHAMDQACMNLAEKKLFLGSFGVHSDRLALSLTQKI